MIPNQPAPFHRWRNAMELTAQSHFRRAARLTVPILLLGLSIGLTVRTAAQDTASSPSARHIVLISLDGFHDFDVARYVATHPKSAMARLVGAGVNYANAYTTGPSDSFPGSLALMTGGTPVSTGIIYDNSWDDTLSPPGSNCATIGTQVLYDESVNTGTDPGFRSRTRTPARSAGPLRDACSVVASRAVAARSVPAFRSVPGSWA